MLWQLLLKVEHLASTTPGLHTPKRNVLRTGQQQLSDSAQHSAPMPHSITRVPQNRRDGENTRKVVLLVQ